MGTPEPLRTDYPFSNAHSSSPRSLESGIRRFAQPKARSGIRGLLSRMFTRSSQQDLDIPIQECPGMSGTSSELEEPSRLKKRNVPPCHCLDKQQKRKRQLFLIILIIILLYLLGNMVAVNIQVFSTRSSSNGHSLSAVQSLCLAEFTVNAAVNASTYPCSSCLPVLQTISEGASFLSQEDRSTLQNSLQFCGLRSLVIASGASSQASFINGGWIQDTSFCSWSGVGCDGEGRVSSLELTFPNVPSIIPSGIGALTALQTLKVTGDGNIPAGSLPDSFTNLTSIQSLDIESTAIDALPSNLFSSGSLESLTSLSFVKNPNLGNSVTNIGNLRLQTLVINDQALSVSISDLLHGENLQGTLETLSITSASLNTTLPSLSGFSSLKELHLDFDNLSGSVPSDAFPSSIQILSLKNNTALTGSLPNSLCSSISLSTCILAGTSLSLGHGCGVCTLSS
ncbi:hypothetical protein PNOK_0130700 [Pyrrhoderma noxium]|uniref:L domain-like protein n=1 Tax=Pyrrhoderma noxium TaxID=2282107 RepID=A0A286UXB5_9AGAM|nr:hypothetical protein PNOK_0130700 [Pyrrhoderma noxium]